MSTILEQYKIQIRNIEIHRIILKTVQILIFNVDASQNISKLRS